MTAQVHERKYSLEVRYVDDVLKSVPSTQQAVHLTSDLTKLLKEGGFRLTKFANNSQDVLQSISPELSANPRLDFFQLQLKRALGVYWDAQSDTFTFKALQSGKPPTKRGVLSTVSSLFDTLRFPFALRVLRWDSAAGALERYTLLGLSNSTTVPLTMATLVRRATTCHHHWYPKVLQNSDASQLINCPTSQLRWRIQTWLCSSLIFALRRRKSSGKIHCSFVLRKPRNAPIREWTIARLELRAAVLAARLRKMILREVDLPVGQPSSDYIKNEKRGFQTFCTNCVAEIHETRTPEQ